MVTSSLLLNTNLHRGLSINDRYHLLERIAVGGESHIWSAWSAERREVVVIRFLEAAPLTSTSDETLLVKSLDHPCLATVYDAGTFEALVYTVTAYYPVGAMDKILRLGALPRAKALAIITQLGAALDYIHQRNIVHRDVKPANMLIDSIGQIYLTDFGLARIIPQGENITNPLHTGQGTAMYASPEQHSMAHLTYQSDIYSLGITFFQMITGRLPFGGQVAFALRQLDEDERLPAPQSVKAGLPAALTDVLRHITARVPTERPASAGQAVRMIVQALGADDLPPLNRYTDSQRMAADAVYIYERSLPEPHITNFAFIDSVMAATDRFDVELTANEQATMLRYALLYDWHTDYWWNVVDHPHQRRVTLEGLTSDTEAFRRGVHKMVEGGQVAFSQQLVEGLLAFVTTSGGDLVDVLRLITTNIKPAGTWRQNAFGRYDSTLTDLALSDVEAIAQGAIDLILKARIKQPIHDLWAAYQADNPQALDALLMAYQIDEGLPDDVPIEMRLRLLVEKARRDVVDRLLPTGRVLAASFVGAAAAMAAHSFLSFRYQAAFFTSTRILNAIGVGLIFAPLIALTIAIVRLGVEGVTVGTKPLRLLLLTILGSIVFALNFIGYHILSLGAAPDGVGVLFGGALGMAFAVALSAALAWPRLMRAVIAGGGIALCLIGTWALANMTGASPIVYYEGEAQALMLASLFGLLIGIFGFSFSIERSL